MSVSLYGSGNTVIQVVSATSTSTVSTTSTTFVDASFTATITPQSTTSKILIIPHINLSAGGSYSSLLTIYRGTIASGTNLGNGTGGMMVCYNVAASTVGTSYLDSPSTTSSVTYSLAFRTENASSTAIISPTFNETNTFTLLEISGS